MAATRTITAGLHTNAYTISTNGYTVINLGTVSVTSPIAIDFLGRGDTLNAFGAITAASYAVRFAPGIQNRLIINPGASFSGVVSGGNTLGSKTVTTLELAYGATAGTLTGLNSTYIDFGQVTVDFGATWLFAGGSTIGNHQIVTNAGYLVNAAGAAGTIFTNGLGSAGSAGLILAAGGAVSNSGRIGGGAGGAGYKGLDGIVSPPPQTGWQGGAGGAGVVATAARVTNTGTIIGGAGGAGGAGGSFVNLGGNQGAGAAGGAGGAGGLGVSLASQATLTNSGGLISGGAGGGGGAGGTSFGLGGNGGAGGAAVYGTSGTVDNFAIIQGGSGGPGGFGGNGLGNGSAGSGGIGIQLTGGGTIVNETGGLIAGGALPGSLYADAILIGTGTSRVVIHPGATFEGNVDGGNTVGSAISALELAGGAAAGTLSGGIGTKYAHFSQVTIDAGAQWTLAAAATLAGVVLTEGGTLTNANTMSNNSGVTGFGVTLATGATLINNGQIAAAIDNGISGRTGAGTILNHGQIDGGTLGASAVYLGGGGYVANYQGATLLGQFGIQSAAPLTIENSGIVEAAATGSGSGIYLAGGAITNQAGGTIQGYYGVRTRTDPVSIINAGVIRATGAGVRVGVLLQASGAVTNQPGGYIQGSFVGIATRGVTTIDNYGTIVGGGGNAILLEFGYGAGYTGRLVMHPGGVFQGAVKGVDTPGHTLLDTLELAPNSVAATGTVTGLGASIVGFGQIVVDQGATWQFAGSNVVNYGFTLSDSGLLINAGSLAVGSGGAGADGGSPGANGGTGETGGAPIAILAGASFSNGGLVTAGAGGRGGAGAAGAVVSGELGGMGAAGGAGSAALSVASGAVVTNSTSIVGGAGGAGGRGGDAGNNAANDGGAGGVGGNGGVGITLSGASLVNYGVIYGGAGGAGGNGGTNFAGSGAAGGLGGAGVSGTTGFVLNYNTIRGAPGGAAGTGTALGVKGANGVGIQFTAGGTVINGGAIIGYSGADAIDFGTGTSQLIMTPGAAFAGKVDGGNTIGSSFTSVLDLAPSFPGTLSSVGVLRGLSSEFVNFALIRVDSGAIWTFGAGNSLAAGTVLQDQGALSVVGQTVRGGGQIDIAGLPSVTASATVASSAVWQAMSLLTVGGGGDGTLLVTSQANVGAATIEVGGEIGGTGAVTVGGTNSALAASGAMTVGDGGLGMATVRTGGTATSGALTIAAGAGASGSAVNVTGDGSNWQIAGSLIVGAAGFGQLNIDQLGSVAASSLDTGQIAGGAGGINVVGSGATLNVSGALTLGDQGTGSLNIINGGIVTVGSLIMGVGATGAGDMVIGVGSTLAVTTTTVSLGVAGSGVLDIQGGTLSLANGTTLHPGALGRIVQVGGLIDPATVVDASGGSFGGGGTLEASGTVTNTLVATVTGGSETMDTPLITSGDPVNLSGVWDLKAGGTLVLNANTVDLSQTFSFGDGSLDVLVIGHQVTLDGSQVPVPIAADAINNFTATIQSFFAGDTIEVDTTLAASFQQSGSVISVVDDIGGATEGTLTFHNAAQASAWINASGALVDVPLECFARGTWIETVDGPVAVEDLRVGDRVVTHGGAVEPIIWIGKRHVACARHPRPADVWPVRITAGAFGPNEPRRDLLLSPGHAIYLEGVLIPARYLINGTTIRSVPVAAVSYYHVELPRHDVLLAEGLAVESYLDCNDRANFERDGGVMRLFPDFSPARHVSAAWEARGYAPLVVTGAPLAAARRLAEVAQRRAARRVGVG